MFLTNKPINYLPIVFNHSAVILDYNAGCATSTYIKQVWTPPIKLRAFKVSIAAVVISTAFNYAKCSIGIMNQIHRNVHEQNRHYEKYSLVVLEIHKTFQHIFASPSTKQIFRFRFPFFLFSLLHSFFFHCKSSDFCAPTTTSGDLHNFCPSWIFHWCFFCWSN